MEARAAHAARTALLNNLSDGFRSWEDRPEQSCIRELGQFSQVAQPSVAEEWIWGSAQSYCFERLKRNLLHRVSNSIETSLSEAFHAELTQMKVYIYGHHAKAVEVERRRIVRPHSIHLYPFPDYERAYSRLQSFVNEEQDWDGCDGSPATETTAKAVTSFLSAARSKFLSRPSLTLSNSGAVSVVWKNDRDYVTVRFSGAEKFVAISVRDGVSRIALEAATEDFPKELEKCLLESFKDDVRANLRQL